MAQKSSKFDKKKNKNKQIYILAQKYDEKL